MYVFVVLATMLVLPVASILAQAGNADLLTLIGRWFVFWAAGARLLVAGIRQIIAPRLTLDGIFGATDARALPLVQELGFWNVSIGVLCLLSLLYPAWLVPLALASGLFYALAGIKHSRSRQGSSEATLAMASDLGAALVLLGYAAARLATAAR